VSRIRPGTRTFSDCFDDGDSVAQTITLINSNSRGTTNTWKIALLQTHNCQPQVALSPHRGNTMLTIAFSQETRHAQPSASLAVANRTGVHQLKQC
jgi:hypothetical protein